MTKPIGGEVVEAAAHPELLAPGTARRPPHITAHDWARMPWPARWKAARAHADWRPETMVERDVEDWHGTYTGYERHRRQLETPCADCLDAMRAYHRDRRGQTRVRVRAFDQVLVDRFIVGAAHWSDLTVEERIAAARRLDAAGVSRQVIRERTHLNTANARRAFASSTGRVAENRWAAQDAQRAS